MVAIAQTVSKIIQTKSNSNQASQLASAGKELRKNKSGSAQLYADGLERASKAFKGKTITQDNAATLIQALMGGGQSKINTQQQTEPCDDILSSILGSLGGDQPDDGGDKQTDFDIGDLVNVGMSFMDSKQKGSSNTEALINAVLSSGPLGQSNHRSQSGTLVANTIMQVLGSMTKK